MAVQWTCDRCGKPCSPVVIKKEYNKIADLCNACFRKFDSLLHGFLKEDDGS